MYRKLKPLRTALHASYHIKIKNKLRVKLIDTFFPLEVLRTVALNVGAYYGAFFNLTKK